MKKHRFIQQKYLLPSSFMKAFYGLEFRNSIPYPAPMNCGTVLKLIRPPSNMYVKLGSDFHTKAINYKIDIVEIAILYLQ